MATLITGSINQKSHAFCTRSRRGRTGRTASSNTNDSSFLIAPTSHRSLSASTTSPISTTPTTMAANIAFKDGYIKDEWSQLAEPIQRGVEGRAFLWTGRKAEVGQRTETQVTTPTDGTKEGWCRLSGVVTEVGAMPTLDQWRAGNSCQLPPGVKSNALPIEDQSDERDGYIEHFGTLHGQTITSYACLNMNFYDRQESLPFKRGRVYKVQLHMWQMRT